MPFVTVLKHILWYFGQCSDWSHFYMLVLDTTSYLLCHLQNHHERWQQNCGPFVGVQLGGRPGKRCMVCDINLSCLPTKNMLSLLMIYFLKLTRILELETALLSDCDINVIRKISNQKSIPNPLRYEYWQVGVPGNDFFCNILIFVPFFRFASESKGVSRCWKIYLICHSKTLSAKIAIN